MVTTIVVTVVFSVVIHGMSYVISVVSSVRPAGSARSAGHAVCSGPPVDPSLKFTPTGHTIGAVATTTTG